MTAAACASDHSISAGGHGHVVDLYDSEALLAESVAGFVGAGLQDQGAAIVIATPAHRAAFADALAGAGVDVGEALADGRYVEVDAAGLLATITVAGVLDHARFEDVAGRLLGRARGSGRRVSVYGELVALLVARDDDDAAIALEDLWNGLGAGDDFELLCGYPAAAFDAARGARLEHICERHTAVISDHGRGLVSGAQDGRLVAGLRQETVWLRAARDRLLAEQESLIEMAYEDPLTGLGNRRALDRHLEHEWAISRRDGADSFIVVADLDDFKALNDEHGHAAGDDVLRRFANALQGAARSADIVARLGGDEFAVLLVRCDERSAHRFKGRLLQSVAAQLGGPIRHMRVSVGYASLARADSPATALDRADLAMLAAKRARRRHGAHAVLHEVGR